MQVILDEAEWNRFQNLIAGESEKVITVIELAKRVIDGCQIPPLRPEATTPEERAEEEFERATNPRKFSRPKGPRYSDKTARLLKSKLEELKCLK